MKSAARCAWVAAVTIARLSVLRTCSRWQCRRRGLTRLKRQIKIGTEERGAEFGHEFFDRVAFGPETLGTEVARQSAIRVRSSASSRAQGWRSSSLRRGRSRMAAARCCLSRGGKRHGSRRERAVGIDARERPLRWALTDDDHVVAVAPVVVNEIATGNSRHVQWSKESRRHAGLAARRASRQTPAPPARFTQRNRP